MIKLPQPICATSDAAAEKPKYTPTHAASAPSSARTSGATIAGKVFPTEAKVCCPNIAASAISIGDTSGLGLSVSAIAAKEQMFHVFDDDQISGRDNDKRDND